MRWIRRRTRNDYSDPRMRPPDLATGSVFVDSVRNMPGDQENLPEPVADSDDAVDR